MADVFTQSVLLPLRRLGRRVRLYLFVEGLAATALAVVTLAAAQFCVDFLLTLDRLPRAVILLGVLAAVAVRLWRRLLAPQRLRVSPERLAATLERRHPELQDRLISAVQFAGAGDESRLPPDDASRAMIADVVRKACEEFARLRPADLLRGNSVRRSGIVLATAVAILAGGASLRGDLLQVFVSRNLLLADVPWPRNYVLRLESARNGLIRWPRGDNLTLMLAGEGNIPRAVSMEYETVGGGTGDRPLSRLGDNRFRCEFGPLEDSMRVRFLASRWGTDERGEWYHVEAVDRPGVRSAVVRVEPPAYTRQKAYALPAGQASADIPAGSRVTFEVRLNKPVVAATLRDAAREIGKAEPLDVGASRSHAIWRASVTPEKSGNFSFALVDEMGLEDTRPVTFSLRLLGDRPPNVRLTIPGAGGMILPEAVLPLRFEFEDNWGLASAEMEYQLDRSGAATQPAPVVDAMPGFETYQTRFTHRRAWDLAPLKLLPADRLIVSARARDFKDFGDPNIGRSIIHNLRVVTRDELLGELSRRENEWRQEFEQIIRAQEAAGPRFMTLRANPPPSDQSLRYASEERAQRQLASRVRRVRTQFEQIVAEMEINRLLTPVIRDRLDRHIIQPLVELDTVHAPAAADLMARLSRAWSAPTADELDAAQVRILRLMNQALANMLKWEGFNEATALLRDILKLQGDVNRQTKEELERQIERMFGPQDEGRQ